MSILVRRRPNREEPSFSLDEPKISVQENDAIFVQDEPMLSQAFGQTSYAQSAQTLPSSDPEDIPVLTPVPLNTDDSIPVLSPDLPSHIQNKAFSQTNTISPPKVSLATTNTSPIFFEPLEPQTATLSPAEEISIVPPIPPIPSLNVEALHNDISVLVHQLLNQAISQVKIQLSEELPKIIDKYK